MLWGANMDSFKVYCLVGLGSALGGMGRLWVSNAVGRRWGESFPWGTLLVNISGSLLIGLIFAMTGPNGRWVGFSRLTMFLMAGICGGYTTFSAFSLQTLHLARQGNWGQAGAYILLSLALCLTAVAAGYFLGLLANRL